MSRACLLTAMYLIRDHGPQGIPATAIQKQIISKIDQETSKVKYEKGKIA